MSKSSHEYPAFAKLKGELANEELPTLRNVGLLDKRTIRKLETIKESYEPNTRPHYEQDGEMAYWYYNTEMYVRTVRRAVGEQLSEAVKSGNRSVVNHAVGLEQENTTEMDFLDYEKLADLIEKPSLLLLIFGDTGSGKSFTGVRLAELWKYRVSGTVLTNVESLAEATDEVVYIDSYVDLLLYCIENQHERKLLLADELSSLMSGYGSDRQAVETYMRPLVRKMRKEPFRLSVVGIGHRMGDIHPTLRNGELAYFGMKHNKTSMDVYETEDLEDVKCSVDGIGLPNWQIDTEDDGTWEWGSEEDILDVARELRDAGYGDILRLIDNLEEEDKEDDEWHNCQARTNKDEQCPNKAKYPSDDPVVCANHRHKMEKFSEE